MKNLLEFIKESMTHKLRNPIKERVLDYLKNDASEIMDVIEQSGIEYKVDAVNTANNMYLLWVNGDIGNGAGSHIGWHKVYKRLGLTDEEGQNHCILVLNTYDDDTIIIDLGPKSPKTEKIYKYLKRNRKTIKPLYDFNTEEWLYLR